MEACCGFTILEQDVVTTFVVLSLKYHLVLADLCTRVNIVPLYLGVTTLEFAGQNVEHKDFVFLLIKENVKDHNFCRVERSD